MMKLAPAQVALTLLLAPLASSSAAEPADPAFAASVAPVLKTYCFTCHGGGKPKSDLALDTLGPDFARHADVWKGVRARLIDVSMPPKGKQRPTGTESTAV